MYWGGMVVSSQCQTCLKRNPTVMIWHENDKPINSEKKNPTNLNWLDTVRFLYHQQKSVYSVDSHALINLRRHSSAAWLEGVVTKIRPKLSWKKKKTWLDQTHLKNMLLKMDHFLDICGEKRTCLKPPPTKPTVQNTRKQSIKDTIFAQKFVTARGHCWEGELRLRDMMLHIWIGCEKVSQNHVDQVFEKRKRVWIFWKTPSQQPFHPAIFLHLPSHAMFFVESWLQNLEAQKWRRMVDSKTQTINAPSHRIHEFTNTYLHLVVF